MHLSRCISPRRRGVYHVFLNGNLLFLQVWVSKIGVEELGKYTVSATAKAARPDARASVAWPRRSVPTSYLLRRAATPRGHGLTAFAHPTALRPPLSASDTVVILEFHFISFVIVNVEYISIAAFADVIFAQEMAGSARGHKPA